MNKYYLLHQIGPKLCRITHAYGAQYGPANTTGTSAWQLRSPAESTPESHPSAQLLQPPGTPKCADEPNNPGRHHSRLGVLVWVIGSDHCLSYPIEILSAVNRYLNELPTLPLTPPSHVVWVGGCQREILQILRCTLSVLHLKLPPAGQRQLLYTLW